MPRKGHISKRELAPDPVYGSTLANKFINCMMWQGKKSTSQSIFYSAMTKLQEKGGDEALKLFKKAVENCKPVLEVKTRQLRGESLPEMQGQMREHPFVVQKAFDAARSVTPDQLEAGLRALLDYEWEVKSGQIDAEAGLLAVLAKL